MSSPARQGKALRIRLAALNLLVLALVLAVTLGSAALSAVRARATSIDADLREVADRVILKIDHERDERAEHRPAPAAHDDEDDEEDEHDRGRGDRPRRAAPSQPPGSDDTLERLEVEDEPGTIVLLASATGVTRRVGGESVPTGLPDVASIAKALEGRETFSDVSLKGGSVRVLSVPIRSGNVVVGAVQVARPTTESRASLTRTLLILAVTGAIGLVLSLVGSLVLADRAMRPIELAFDRQRRFIADASHELRTPVAVVRARAELLAHEAPGLDSATRAELAQLSRDAEELSTLLVDLLDLARLDADQAPLEVGPVPLAEVAEEVAQQLEPLARARGVSLTTRGEVVFAQANLPRLRQVLRALGDNAVKHSRSGGTVTIVCDRLAGRARTQITDDGEGIAENHLPHVKDRFYRADPARTRGGVGAAGGAGLGLAIAQELVEKMGGTLTIESELGQGTVVTVLLALSSPSRPRDG